MGRYAHWLKKWEPGPRRALEYNEDQLAWLEHNVHLGAPDLRTVDRAYLLREFSQTSRKGTGQKDVNDRLFLRTLIWQAVERILRGEQHPIRGNLRSFWYSDVRFLLEDLGLLEPEAPRPPDSPEPTEDLSHRARYLLKSMEGAFEDFFSMGFYRYDDLEVYDSRAGFRKLGTNKPRLILNSEKEGLFWLVQELAEKYSISCIASRGSPSWVAVDFFATAIRARKGTSNLSIASFTDYDPWGEQIAHQLGDKLFQKLPWQKKSRFGFRTVRSVYLTHPNLYEPEKLQRAKRYLLKGHEDENDPVHKVVMDWVARGFGVNGQPYGIHADHADPTKVDRAVKRWVDSH